MFGVITCDIHETRQMSNTTCGLPSAVKIICGQVLVRNILSLVSSHNLFLSTLSRPFQFMETISGPRYPVELHEEHFRPTYILLNNTSCCTNTRVRGGSKDQRVCVEEAAQVGRSVWRRQHRSPTGGLCAGSMRGGSRGRTIGVQWRR